MDTANEKRARYAELIQQLPGVYAANVVLQDDLSIREVHIIASSARAPKQVSRDVQSALLAAFDAAVDHRVISIAQLNGNPFAEDPVLPSANETRLRCAGVMGGVEDDHYTVRVHLALGQTLYSGESVCRNTPSRRINAAVEATLCAVHNALGQDDLFTLLATQSTMVGGVNIAITLLEYAAPHGERLLIGAARQDGDAATGFVKSTLDALNRSFALAVEADAAN